MNEQLARIIANLATQPLSAVMLRTLQIIEGYPDKTCPRATVCQPVTAKALDKRGLIKYDATLQKLALTEDGQVVLDAMRV